MPASTFTLGFGSIISVATTFAGTYAVVAQSRDLNSPESEVAKVKITNNSSPSNSQEYAAGLIDPGDVEFEWVYSKTQQATLYGYWSATPSTTLFWKEIFPDGSGYTFTGFITKISLETKTENEAITGKVSIALTTSAIFNAVLS
jgi:hypothetical protein